MLHNIFVELLYLNSIILLLLITSSCLILRDISTQLIYSLFHLLDFSFIFFDYFLLMTNYQIFLYNLFSFFLKLASTIFIILF